MSENLLGLKKSGITEQTPESLMLGAGTIYKNLTWSTDKWTGDIIGATNGGSTFKYDPVLVDVPMDGALVKVKGLAIKQGESASLEINLAEMSKASLQTAMLGATASSSDATGFDKIESKSSVIDSDYLDNVAYVGFLASGKPVIIILGNALCTSGLELSGKNKENGVIKVKFECYSDAMGEGSTDKLPVTIYYPSAIVATPPAPASDNTTQQS